MALAARGVYAAAAAVARHAAARASPALLCSSSSRAFTPQTLRCFQPAAAAAATSCAAAATAIRGVSTAASDSEPLVGSKAPDFEADAFLPSGQKQLQKQQRTCRAARPPLYIWLCIWNCGDGCIYQDPFVYTYI